MDDDALWCLGEETPKLQCGLRDRDRPRPRGNDGGGDPASAEILDERAGFKSNDRCDPVASEGIDDRREITLGSAGPGVRRDEDDADRVSSGGQERANRRGWCRSPSRAITRSAPMSIQTVMRITGL